jgi:flagellar export protein FliJ
VSEGFRFPLEPLLQIRRARENELAGELARARRRLDRAQALLRRYEGGFSEALSLLGREGSRPIAELERAATLARTSAGRCAQEVEIAAAALAAAVRDRKAIEALKNRRAAKFAAAEARKEERELDEANHR